jgi:hypothetical protein
LQARAGVLGAVAGFGPPGRSGGAGDLAGGDRGAASGEAVTVDQALTDFHAR